MRDTSIATHHYQGPSTPSMAHMFDFHRGGQPSYPYGPSDQDQTYSYRGQIPRSSTLANSLTSRQLPLPALPIRANGQTSGISQSCSLPPIQTARTPPQYSGATSKSSTISPAEVSSAPRASSIPEGGIASSGDVEGRRSTSTITPSGSGPYQPLAPRSISDEENDDDQYARRETLVPDIVIPPMYEWGSHVAIAQKQNCGRRTAKTEPDEFDLSDPNKRRALDKRNDHTNAERHRRNDHKNLAMDLYIQTPIKFLQMAGWHDQAKEPIKKVQLHAAVIYMNDLARTCTNIYNSERHLKQTVARQEEEIRMLKLELQDRRPSLSSKTDSSVNTSSVSSSFKSEPPTPDGHEPYSFMEPRVPASGPSTPAFSLRSSPMPRSRPASRANSPPRTLLPHPLSSNSDFHFPTHHKRKPDESSWANLNRPFDHSDFQFPNQHKRKPEDQEWVILNKPMDQPDAVQLSPKRARY